MSLDWYSVIDQENARDFCPHKLNDPNDNKQVTVWPENWISWWVGRPLQTRFASLDYISKEASFQGNGQQQINLIMVHYLETAGYQGGI